MRKFYASFIDEKDNNKIRDIDEYINTKCWAWSDGANEPDDDDLDTMDDAAYYEQCNDIAYYKKCYNDLAKFAKHYITTNPSIKTRKRTKSNGVISTTATPSTSISRKIMTRSQSRPISATTTTMTPSITSLSIASSSKPTPRSTLPTSHRSICQDQKIERNHYQNHLQIMPPIQYHSSYYLMI